MGESHWSGAKSVAIAIVATMVTMSSASAAELTAQQIVDKSLDNNSLGVSDAISQVTLTLISKRGTKRVRKIEIRSKEIDKKNKTLVRFHAPADVAGTGFLRLDLEEDDEEQYLYLPALGKVKRITGNQRNQRFMGTDLTYADLENGNLKNADLKRLPDVKYAGGMVYVIEAIPKPDGDGEYGKTVSWIHKKSFVPLKVEFYDKKLKMLKILKVKRLEKKDGNWVAMDSKIENVQKKTKTLMLINSIKFNVNLKASDFTQRALSGG
jgi:outer membrane lipoprotein-sorting protein